MQLEEVKEAGHWSRHIMEESRALGLIKVNQNRSQCTQNKKKDQVKSVLKAAGLPKFQLLFKYNDNTRLFRRAGF